MNKDDLLKLGNKLALNACVVSDYNGEPVQDQWAWHNYIEGFLAALELLWPCVEALENEANSSRAGVLPLRKAIADLERKVNE